MKKFCVMAVMLLVVLCCLPASGADKKIVADTDKYTAVFSEQEGSLLSWSLKGYQETCLKCKKDTWLRLKNYFFRNKMTDTYFPESSGAVNLVCPQQRKPADISLSELNNTPLPSLKYRLASDTDSGTGRRTIAFAGEFESIKIVKTYELDPANYAFNFNVKVSNLSPIPVTWTPLFSWHQSSFPENHSGKPDRVRSIVSVRYGDVESAVPSKGDGTGRWQNIEWAAYDSRYFIAAILPGDPAGSYVDIENSEGGEGVNISVRGQRMLLPAGQDLSFSYTVYLGPKAEGNLKALGGGLEYAIDYGWLRIFALPLLLLLNIIQGFVGNYGLAIVIMAVLVKTVFLPLGIMGFRSMKGMRELRPKLEELKITHAGDKDALGRASAELYKEHNVNPFGGCFPVLIQLPVFVGLYRVLLNSVELRHSPMFFWIQDLSSRDPYLILPLLAGGAQFIVQRLAPPAGSEEINKVMMWMPVFFTFIFMGFPAGLVLYWLFSNLMQIGIQLYLNGGWRLTAIKKKDKEPAASQLLPG